MNVVIYNQDSGGVAVLVPTEEALQKFGIMEIAIRDVPAGRPFKILDTSELPDAPQEAWEVDDIDLTDGIGERQ